jgi:hypothetical protein
LILKQSLIYCGSPRSLSFQTFPIHGYQCKYEKKSE